MKYERWTCKWDEKDRNARQREIERDREGQRVKTTMRLCFMFQSVQYAMSAETTFNQQLPLSCQDMCSVLAISSSPCPKVLPIFSQLIPTCIKFLTFSHLIQLPCIQCSPMFSTFLAAIQLLFASSLSHSSSHPSSCMSVCQSVCMSVCLSACLSLLLSEIQFSLSLPMSCSFASSLTLLSFLSDSFLLLSYCPLYHLSSVLSPHLSLLSPPFLIALTLYLSIYLSIYLSPSLLPPSISQWCV